MKNFVAEVFEQKQTSIWSSWQFVQSDFAEEFAFLRQNSPLVRNGKHRLIWRTKQKFVLKITTASGKTFAYKAYDKLKKKYKFFFRLSPCGAEAVNYQLIKSINIPVPQIWAAGDIRKKGVLQTAFIATEFAEGYLDGREFLADGKYHDRLDLQEEFIVRHLQLLARLHDHNILHRGFTPMNLLFRISDKVNSADCALDIMWIDVASCRKMPRFMLKKRMIVDFEQFFRFFEFSTEELRKYLNVYLAAAEKPLAASADEILPKLEKALQKRRKR